MKKDVEIFPEHRIFQKTTKHPYGNTPFHELEVFTWITTNV